MHKKPEIFSDSDSDWDEVNKIREDVEHDLSLVPNREFLDFKPRKTEPSNESAKKEESTKARKLR